MDDGTAQGELIPIAETKVQGTYLVAEHPDIVIKWSSFETRDELLRSSPDFRGILN